MARENSLKETVDSLFKGMDGFVSSKTVVGEATHIDDTIIIPLVDVSFGIGAGSANGEKSGGGCGGMGAKLSPSAILVIHEGRTKLVNIKNQDTMTKIIDLIPDLVDRFKEKGNPSKITDDEARKIALKKEDEE